MCLAWNGHSLRANYEIEVDGERRVAPHRPGCDATAGQVERDVPPVACGWTRDKPDLAHYLEEAMKGSLLSAHAARGMDGNGVASPASDATPPSPSWSPLPAIPYPLLRSRPGVVAWRGMACCVALVEQVSATVVPSLGAHDPLVRARVGRAGDGGAEPAPGQRCNARSRSPRTSPRRARNSGPVNARRWPRGGWRAGMETSRNSRYGRSGRSDEGGATNRRRRGTRHIPSRSAKRKCRSEARLPSIILLPGFFLASWPRAFRYPRPAMMPAPPVPAVDCHQSTYGPL